MPTAAEMPAATAGQPVPSVPAGLCERVVRQSPTANAKYDASRDVEAVAGLDQRLGDTGVEMVEDDLGGSSGINRLP